MNSGQMRTWRLKDLLREEFAEFRARRASSRLLELTAGLEPGALITVTYVGNGSGKVTVRLSTTSQLDDFGDMLDWVGEQVHTWEPEPDHDVAEEVPESVMELLATFQAPAATGSLDMEDPLVFHGDGPPAPRLWPTPVDDSGIELLRTLTSTTAEVRVHLSPASPTEVQMLDAQFRGSVQTTDQNVMHAYMRTPVRVRCLVGQPHQHLSPRLRAALLRLAVGTTLVPRDVGALGTGRAWRGEPSALAGAAQPFGFAQCMVRLPASGEHIVPCGLPTSHAAAEPVPLSPGDHSGDGLRLGVAHTTDGVAQEVRLPHDSLLLHTQVLGATGTGKSTLLAAMVAEAAAAGMGVTVLECHRALVGRILDELPADAADRTLVVRSGDLDHPVPLNVLSGPSADVMGDVMIQVLRDLLDPRNQGFLGPRFERIFALLLQAQRVLVGDRATLSAMPHLLRNPAQVRELARVVSRADPELASQLVGELGRVAEHEFAEISGWANAKFQRLLSTRESRAILGTGVDAVDVTEVMDERQILLVDLDSLTLTPMGAQLLGEMWLAKHWAALAQRRDPSQPHLLIVDEAHLFGSGLLPRLLAEARKFGLGVVMAHQHLEQLTDDLREAALATTNNVIVFRSGPREAAASTIRLGDWAGSPLTRLPTLHAAATLTNRRSQTAPFTLHVDHNERSQGWPDNTEVRRHVERRSHEHLVFPFSHIPAMTQTSMDELIRRTLHSSPSIDSDSTVEFLERWRKRRDDARCADNTDDGQ